MSANTAPAPLPILVTAPTTSVTTMAVTDVIRSQNTDFVPIFFIFSLSFREISPEITDTKITGATKALISFT